MRQRAIPLSLPKQARRSFQNDTSLRVLQSDEPSSEGGRQQSKRCVPLSMQGYTQKPVSSGRVHARTARARDACAQLMIHIRVPSTPHPDAFAVVLQAILTHLLFMREQMPAPFSDLLEVRSFAENCAVSLGKCACEVRAWQQRAACAADQQQPRRGCRKTPQARKTAKVSTWSCCRACILLCCPDVCYRDSSSMRLARFWQPCQDACLKGTRTRARCCCSDPPCRGHWRHMTSGSSQAVRPRCKQPASTLRKVPRAWCAACCVSSSAARQTCQKAGPQQARPCLHLPLLALGAY